MKGKFTPIEKKTFDFITGLLTSIKRRYILNNMKHQAILQVRLDIYIGGLVSSLGRQLSYVVI